MRFNVISTWLISIVFYDIEDIYDVFEHFGQLEYQNEGILQNRNSYSEHWWNFLSNWIGILRPILMIETALHTQYSPAI